MSLNEYVKNLKKQIDAIQTLEKPVENGDERYFVPDDKSNVYAQKHSIQRIDKEIALMLSIKEPLVRIQAVGLRMGVDIQTRRDTRYALNLLEDKLNLHFDLLLSKHATIAETLRKKDKENNDEFKKTDIIVFSKLSDKIIKVLDKHNKKNHQIKIKDIHSNEPYLKTIFLMIKSIILCICMPHQAIRRFDFKFDTEFFIEKTFEFITLKNLFILGTYAALSSMLLPIIAQSTLMSRVLASPLLNALQPAITALKNATKMKRIIAGMLGLKIIKWATINLLGQLPCLYRVKEVAQASVNMDTYLNPLPKMFKTAARNERELAKSIADLTNRTLDNIHEIYVINRFRM